MLKVRRTLFSAFTFVLSPENSVARPALSRAVRAHATMYRAHVYFQIPRNKSRARSTHPLSSPSPRGAFCGEQAPVPGCCGPETNDASTGLNQESLLVGKQGIARQCWGSAWNMRNNRKSLILWRGGWVEHTVMPKRAWMVWWLYGRL